MSHRRCARAHPAAAAPCRGRAPKPVKRAVRRGATSSATYRTATAQSPFAPRRQQARAGAACLCMSSPLWQAVSAAADAAAARAAAVAGCSPRALKACVGTALAVVAVHQLLASRRAAAATVEAQYDGAAPTAPTGTRAAPQAPLSAARSPARVCVATPGVIFAGPADVLAEGAQTVAQHAAVAVAALAAVADVYLITQVAPGEGAVRAEAAARESLAAAGIVGSGSGAVPPHRALFCTTLVGRIALARQARILAPVRRACSVADGSCADCHRCAGSARGRLHGGCSGARPLRHTVGARRTRNW